MNLLNIPFSREKVAKVFKERFGLAYANSMTKLILFQNGKLAWFYSAASGPQKAICLGKDQFRLLKADEKLPSYRVIGKDEYFYIGKNIYQCRCFIKNQMLIKKVSEVLRAEEARMIMKTEKEPEAYKIIQTDGSVSNIIWKTSPNENAAFVFAFLEGDCRYNKKCRLIPLEYTEEVTIGKHRWMYHTEKGLPILRELVRDMFWQRLSH